MNDFETNGSNYGARDQLYFDRMHPSMPILHQSRYLSWSNQPDKKLSRRCLQSAMWTLASLVSMQLQHLQDALYRETKQHLGSMTSSDSHGFIADTERLQALVLTAVYEVMKTYHQQAWMSVGQAFRLAQLMRFHEIDRHDNCSFADESYTEIEEQRRAFWMAYVVENILSIRNGLPVSLNAHLVGDIISCEFNSLQEDADLIFTTGLYATPSLRHGISESKFHSWQVYIGSDFS